MRAAARCRRLGLRRRYYRRCRSCLSLISQHLYRMAASASTGRGVISLMPSMSSHFVGGCFRSPVFDTVAEGASSAFCHARYSRPPPGEAPPARRLPCRHMREVATTSALPRWFSGRGDSWRCGYDDFMPAEAIWRPGAMLITSARCQPGCRVLLAALRPRMMAPIMLLDRQARLPITE